MILPVASGLRVAQFRISASKESACFQVTDVKDASGNAWVTPPSLGSDYGNFCQSCPQRVSVGAKSALYLLPSSEPVPNVTSSLTMRVSLRDCTTFLPTADASVSLAVEGRTDVPVLPQTDTQEGRIPLQIIITAGSVFHDQTDVLPASLAAAIDVANGLLSAGHLAVEAVRVRRIQGEDPLVVQRGEHSALDRVGKESFTCSSGSVSMEDAVPVVLTGCLQVRDPLLSQTTEVDGYTPHIPDGFTGSTKMHGVFLKGRSCSAAAPPVDLGPQVLGKLLAHELGHYLGLYHSIESDGTTDLIADSGADNLMHFRPLQSVSPTFSPGQFRMMRRHPAIRWQ